MKISKLKVCGDSTLVIKQLNIDFLVKVRNLLKYREEIREKLQDFDYELSISHILKISM